MVEEPQTRSFGKYHQHECKDQLNGNSGREKLAHTDGVPALSQFKGKEAADGRRNAGCQEGEHRNHTADSVVHAVIRLPQCSQHHAGSEETDKKQQQHTHIQEQSIAGNPLAVFRQALTTCVCMPVRIQNNRVYFLKSPNTAEPEPDMEAYMAPRP